MLILFSCTLFVSAFLLFWVQPMFGKMILPMLGSTPNVWNTCMLFFQAALLLGYIYAHSAIKLLGVRKQVILHAILIFLPLLVLPIIVPRGWLPPTDSNPVFWLLFLLLVAVGLPFFMVSTSAPLLQKWFSYTEHKDAKDPYFLYAASNLGSMLALLSYPFLVEPNLTLKEQSNLWFYFYFLFLALVLCCGFVLWRSLVTNTASNYSSNGNLQEITIGKKIYWILLSFVPSSLMLGVTTYLTTDISAVPLLWILPLVLYLLTFILVFAKKQIFSHDFMIKIFPFVILLVLVFLISERTKIIWINFFLHLFTLFVVCMVCHGELAKNRPDTKHLTEFYIWISVGGCLGGVFNTLIAPVMFNSIVEYPLALVLACLLRPSSSKESRFNIWDIMMPLFLAIFIFILFNVFHADDLKPDWLSNIISFVLPLVLCYLFINRQIRFGLGVAVVIFVTTFCINIKKEILYTERSFFGVHRIVHDYLNETEKCNFLLQGNTLHGSQCNNFNRYQPLTYYYPTGPVGQLFTMFSGDKSKSKIALIGLGVGSLTSYGRLDQNWTYYEIDPVVKNIATNKNYFTFLHDAKAMWNIVLGDGRLSIKSAPNNYYDFLIVDAFNSGSIPIHLITREALKLYLNKLTMHGIIAFHITNRYIDLQTVLGDLALDAKLVSLIQSDMDISPEERKLGKATSKWVIMARRKEDFGKLSLDSRWKPLIGDPTRRVWTDDFSNIISVLKRR